MTAQMVERNNQTRPDTPPRTPGRHRPERNSQVRRDRTPDVPWEDEPDRMPLRTDLFLIAHCDDTGLPRLDKHSVSIGLAAAVLVELWHARRVRLGWRGNPEQCTWERNHTEVTLLDASATGDHINDAALMLLWRMGGTVNTAQFINQLAATDLYDQVRDHLTDLRILHRFHTRRFLFFKTEHRRPRNAAHAVKARDRIRNVAALHRPHPKDTKLAALVTALGLSPYIRFKDHSTGGVQVQLAELIGPEHPINDITAIVAHYRLRFS